MKLLTKALSSLRGLGYQQQHAAIAAIVLSVFSVLLSFFPATPVAQLFVVLVNLVVFVSVLWFAYTYTGNRNVKWKRFYHLLYAITGEEKYLKEYHNEHD